MRLLNPFFKTNKRLIIQEININKSHAITAFEKNTHHKLKYSDFSFILLN